ncbi:short-chain dehydrogenase/reductase SDR [Reticulomyxa filosa]|uniref:Short-chain dehydrogenase/reductase SDR n=1 Tax=Reticulomyxa filosa TaxID=46433 RepID=X6MI28_RETFI|nr:short-chain dehydrogenase/reductase SDR [Reticulomyxa filosa]|eukprot:ETO13087.1 short-chain dehydrogenase/reductase SDR [Reticulomyxa filosa]
MTQEIAKKGCAVIVGVGPGLGRSLALRFAKGGYHVALVSRSKTSTEPVAKEILTTHKNIKTLCLSVNTQEEDIKKAHKEIQTELGDVEVLCYNASTAHNGIKKKKGFNKKSITEVTQEEMMNAFNVSCVGAAIWSKVVVPAMIQNQKGTILFTG